MESVLHRRYKVTERLFSNTLGELFLGRDAQAAASQTLLIHYLPLQLLSDSALKQSLTTLQNLGRQAEVPILQVLDCAWSDTEVLFVMQAPEAWSLSVLPVLQGQATKLHQKALATTQQLIDQGLVSHGIDPTLFLVTPSGELHLLGTAFLSELQELQASSPNLLQPQPVPVATKKPSLWPLLFLGATGFVAAGSLGVYQFKKTEPLLPATVVSQVAVSELDKPISNTILASTQVDLSQSSAAIHTESTVKHQALPTTNLQALSSPSVATKKTDQDLVQPEPTPINTIEKLPSSRQNFPVEANSIATKHLERATEAIKNGHLQTGLYYLRLAKKLTADPEQLQQTAKQLLAQAEKPWLANSEALSASMQENIKAEFGLK